MPDEEQDIPYIWLSDDDWNKLQFHIRTQINAILNPLRAYGQGIYVDGAIEELMKLIDLITQYIRGKDIMVKVIDKPNYSLFEDDG